MSAEKKIMEGDELLQEFVTMYQSGAQGCEMDCDTAQALAIAIKGIMDEANALAVERDAAAPRHSL